MKSIKKLRELTGLSQSQFAKKYDIPVRTLQRWEQGQNRTPQYVINILNQLLDKKNNIPDYMNYYYNAAKQSRYNADHWFRYMRKFINDSGCILTDSEINNLINSDILTMYQKVTLKRALIQGSPTNLKVLSLNKKTNTPMLETIIKRRNKNVQR